MEKLAQAGEGGDARPPPFIIFTITYKVAVYAPSEGADTLPLFHLYPYVTCGRYSIVKRWTCTPTLTTTGRIFPS